MINWDEMKPEDPRPPKGSWATGMYTAVCRVCGCTFIGDKRAIQCADCAYTEEEDKLEERDFGWALRAIKAGKKVARIGWNGKGMFIFLVNGSTFKVSRAPLLGIYPEGTEINYQSHIDMRTADGTIVPWLASQSDMLSDDWSIVE